MREERDGAATILKMKRAADAGAASSKRRARADDIQPSVRLALDSLRGTAGRRVGGSAAKYRNKITYTVHDGAVTLSDLASDVCNETCLAICTWIREKGDAANVAYWHEVSVKCNRRGTALVKLLFLCSSSALPGFLEKDVSRFVKDITESRSVECIVAQHMLTTAKPGKEEEGYIRLHGEYLTEQTPWGDPYIISPDTFCEINHDIEDKSWPFLEKALATSGASAVAPFDLLLMGRDANPAFVSMYPRMPQFRTCFALPHCPRVAGDLRKNCELFVAPALAADDAPASEGKHPAGDGAAPKTNTALERPVSGTATRAEGSDDAKVKQTPLGDHPAGDEAAPKTNAALEGPISGTSTMADGSDAAKAKQTPLGDHQAGDEATPKTNHALEGSISGASTMTGSKDAAMGEQTPSVDHPAPPSDDPPGKAAPTALTGTSHESSAPTSPGTPCSNARKVVIEQVPSKFGYSDKILALNRGPGGRPISVLVNSGRGGFAESTAQAFIANEKVAQIIYVTCNQKTCYADADILLRGPLGFYVHDYASFDFQPGTEYVMQVFDLRRPRFRTAVLPVGPPGSGKSTLAAALVQLLGPGAAETVERDQVFADMRTALPSLKASKKATHERVLGLLSACAAPVVVYDSTSGDPGGRDLIASTFFSGGAAAASAAPATRTVRNTVVLVSYEPTETEWLLNNCMSRVGHVAFPADAEAARAKIDCVLSGLTAPQDGDPCSVPAGGCSRLIVRVNPALTTPADIASVVGVLLVLSPKLAVEVAPAFENVLAISASHYA